MMVVVSGKLLVGWGLPAVWGKLTDTYGVRGDGDAVMVWREAAGKLGWW